ncbi:response regulator [Desulfoglaeba alkanexedens]|jgi:DNA-binding NtrC family response regulator|uniref:Response regulator n=1 Tax=Desulfoglaeba alkanexedens ALDC TaxID=980445 RepID=A0A4P8L417_9BACT|nr:response regulator [Desulfoglaeba alkanexedens]QCQ21522.1 response regulator [Desulfoglaeba alkanexedens ALDC]
MGGEAGSKPQVLIVDDEDRFRLTLGKLLGSRGYPVDSAGSGPEALEKIRDRAFDVILLDVKMPGMSGIEALARIKKESPLSEVIILTGHASVDAAVEIMKLGGYEYLLKPCPMDELTARIDAAYEKKLARERVAKRPQ